MKELQIFLPEGGLKGHVSLPFSKSLSNRQLVLGLHTQRPFVVKGLSQAQDTQYLLRAILEVGYKVAQSNDELTLLPPKRYPDRAYLDVGEGGTTLRFLLPWLCRLPVEALIDVGPSLRRRPILPFIHSLQGAGAQIYFSPDIFPLRVVGDEAWSPTRWHVDSALTSQFLSALFLMAPGLEVGTEIIENAVAPATAAYSEMTRAFLSIYGWQWEKTSMGWSLTSKAPLRDSYHFVGEADWSAASFFFGWAALGGFSGTLNLPIATLQPEAQLFSRLRWGYHLAEFQGGIVLEPTRQNLKGIELSVENFPDAVLVLAVIAAFAESPSYLKGIRTLPYKESDRLKALIQELSKIGASLRVEGDTLIVHPTTALPRAPLSFESYGDHRVAMALSLIAARSLTPISISMPHCVAKSFPDYWEVLKKLGMEIKEGDG